jgi:dihydropteroate synthase
VSDPRIEATAGAGADPTGGRAAGAATPGDRDRGGRRVPREAGIEPADPAAGGARATPSFGLPRDAGSGLPGVPSAIAIGGRPFTWGDRTYVMGIINVTPDSFSGDGLLGGSERAADPVAAALELAASMVADGADLLDVGGESSRPGHAAVPADEEMARIVPVVRALRDAHPEVPISVDTIKPAVAEAALDAGASLVNDVWGVAEDDGLARVAGARGVPLIVMHNRAEARYRSLIAEVVADLERAIERCVRVGVAWESIIVDPGFGFGKTAEHNLALLRDLASLRVLARPILLGTSRKSTLGRVLDLPAEERLEATLATTALGIAAGADIVRVHDVRANVRVARMTDAIVRGGAR